MSKAKTYTKRRPKLGLTAKRARELFRYVKSSGAVLCRATGERVDRGSKGNRYRRVAADGERYQAHRVIWLMETGHWPLKGEVDHADNDGASLRANRWSNLRDASRQQNATNIRTHRDNASGLKWVTTLPNGRFRASMHIYLGEFTCPRQAHERAKAFARERHGQFFNPGARA